MGASVLLVYIAVVMFYASGEEQTIGDVKAAIRSAMPSTAEKAITGDDTSEVTRKAQAAYYAVVMTMTGPSGSGGGGESTVKEAAAKANVLNKGQKNPYADPDLQKACTRNPSVIQVETRVVTQVESRTEVRMNFKRLSERLSGNAPPQRIY